MTTKPEPNSAIHVQIMRPARYLEGDIWYGLQDNHSESSTVLQYCFS